MLADSDLHPQIRLRNRIARTASPKNRAKYLGNDATGMTTHYGNIENNTFDELKPVIHRAKTWDTASALRNCHHHKTSRLSEMVRSDKHDDFWWLYKTLRSLKLSRKRVITFIKTHGTAE